MNKILTVVLAVMVAVTTWGAKNSASPENPRQFSRLLWEGEAPHSKTLKPDSQGNIRAGVDVGDTAKIHVFLPPEDKANGKAVVLCPGGGYAGLCMSYEGIDWAPFFNDRGIALVVLQYRLPEGTWQIPVEDVQEAVRVVRRNAAAWHIDPAKVGVGGSSAGGHLAATASTHFNAPVNSSDVSCRPDFAILYYPVISFMPQLTHTGTRSNLLGSDFPIEHEILFSNEYQVSPETPRTWIGFSHDDSLVNPVNGLRYYEALLKAGVPASLHIYPSGEHGWGFRQDFRYRNEMLADLSAWLLSF